MSQAKLGQCPFCKNENCLLVKQSDAKFSIQCKGCGLLGPHGMDGLGARAKWNYLSKTVMSGDFYREECFKLYKEREES